MGRNFPACKDCGSSNSVCQLHGLCYECEKIKFPHCTGFD